ncbi:MAG: hypothetical protein ACLUE8_17805 [Lachnospiraceae bacterium]
MLLTAYLGVIVLPLRQVTAYFLMAGGLAALAVGLVLLLLDKRQLRQRGAAAFPADLAAFVHRVSPCAGRTC